MSMNVAGRVCGFVTVLTLSAAALSEAQPLGVFRWQLQPYCNSVIFTVVQQGPAYTLTGIDDLCNAGQAAPATGSAAPNPDGTIGLGFVVSTPGGPAAHVSATVTLPSVSGTWRDADGHTGTFAFNGAIPGLPPRPAPTTSAVITSAQLASSIFAGTGAATTLARSDHDHDGRYHPRAAVDARVPPQDSIALAGAGFEARDSYSQAAAGTACFRNQSPSAGLRHVIPVTSGSTITGLTVRVFVNSVTALNYTIAVYRQSPGTATGVSVFSQTPLLTSVGLVTHDFALSEVADPGEALYLTFSSGSTLVSLCAVDVRFNRPS